jgi:hypothetical protein
MSNVDADRPAASSSRSSRSGHTYRSSASGSPRRVVKTPARLGGASAAGGGNSGSESDGCSKSIDLDCEKVSKPKRRRKKDAEPLASECILCGMPGDLSPRHENCVASKLAKVLETAAAWRNACLCCNEEKPLFRSIAKRVRDSLSLHPTPLLRFVWAKWRRCLILQPLGATHAYVAMRTTTIPIDYKESA